MKRPGQVVEKAEKHREWHWCRRKNGFCGMPKWHVVAERLGLPPPTVIAFANWLEEIANDAGNIEGFGRGYVGHFNAGECARALGITAEDAARTYAALEDIAVRWIEDGHIVDFQKRNPDSDDDSTSALRQRRRYARSKILQMLARLGRTGAVATEERLDIELRLKSMADAELFALVASLQQQELSTTSRVRHGRENVSLTAEQNTGFQKGRVDNCGDDASGAAAGSPMGEGADAATNPQAAAQAWLDSEGLRIVTERMQEARTLAATRIARWRDQQLGGDASALVAIIRSADAQDYLGARFHNLIVDGIKRRPREAGPQQELRLPPVGMKRAADG